MLIKKVRKGVFETNSSSCHSLVLSGNDSGDIVDPKVREDTTIVLSDYEDNFRWGVDTYNGWDDKLAYAIMCDGADIEMIKKIFKDVTGHNLIIIFNCEYGIDHESDQLLSGIPEETLKKYIFSPKYYIITGNDNQRLKYCPFCGVELFDYFTNGDCDDEFCADHDEDCELYHHEIVI